MNIVYVLHNYIWIECKNRRKYGLLGDFPRGASGKESACDTGDLSSIPESGRCPGGGNSNPFQYSCLENPRDRGAWWAI